MLSAHREGRVSERSEGRDPRQVVVDELKANLAQGLAPSGEGATWLWLQTCTWEAIEALHDPMGAMVSATFLDAWERGDVSPDPPIRESNMNWGYVVQLGARFEALRRHGVLTYRFDSTNGRGGMRWALKGIRPADIPKWPNEDIVRWTDRMEPSGPITTREQNSE